MDAKEFVKRGNLWVFRYAMAQLSFKPNMYLVAYQYECEFVEEIKPNHGNCVFHYNDVKRYVDAYELVQKFGGKVTANLKVGHFLKHGLTTQAEQLNQAIQLVESVDEN